MDTDTDQGADIFVTAEEAARVAGVSARTVRRWINAGDVQAAEGERGRVVSVSDVRRRAVSGHDRTRPPVESPRTRAVADTDTSALMSAVAGSVNVQMIEIAEQIERLTREAMDANHRAELAEQERDELRAEVELLRAMPQHHEPELETRTMPLVDPPDAAGREESVSMSPSTLHEPSWRALAWSKVRRRSEGYAVADLISVLVTEVRPIAADDGDLWELVVRDLATGVDGSLVVPDDDFRAMLGDCPTSDLVNVDRDCIVWKP